MGLFVCVAWWKMSEPDRVEMVEALMRHRAIMLGGTWWNAITRSSAR